MGELFKGKKKSLKTVQVRVVVSSYKGSAALGVRVGSAPGFVGLAKRTGGTRGTHGGHTRAQGTRGDTLAAPGVGAGV